MDFTADLLNKSVYCAVGAMPRGFTSLALLDGRSMPAFGLGVYRSPAGSECYNAVKWALDLGALVRFPLAASRGYRCVDTAALYGNEASVGEAVRDSQLPREELWITSKLWDSG